MTLDRVAHAVEAAARRAQRSVIVGGAVAVLLATAFGFVTAALYLALVEAVEPVFACLVVAAVYLLGALLVLLAGRRAGEPERERRAPPERPGRDSDALSHLIATFLAGVRAGREGFRRPRR